MAIFKVSIIVEVEARTQADAERSVYNTLSVSPWWRVTGIVASEIKQHGCRHPGAGDVCELCGEVVRS